MVDPIKQEAENIAATVAREARKPFEISGDKEYIALPEGWRLEDCEKMLPTPRRKKALVALSDEAGFVDYLKRHGSLASCTIWCDASYQQGKVGYTAILNDHDAASDGQQWRDHLATFVPEQSVEWKRWNAKNKVAMTQIEFATFIEDNLADIATVANMPTGTAMLQMTTNLEITQDSRIKSAVRLQSGGVRVEYIDDADDATAKYMEVFDTFALGLPVFWNGDAYQLQARLRYRLKEGKLAFWYELQRPDKALEDAAKTLTAGIHAATGFPMYHGNPFKQ